MNQEINTAIKEALATRTKGTWSIRKGEYYHDNFIMATEGTLQTVVASRVMTADETLISNAPTWLSAQQKQIEDQAKEIKKISAERDKLYEGVKNLKKHLASEGDFHAWHIVTKTLKELDSLSEIKTLGGNQ